MSCHPRGPLTWKTLLDPVYRLLSRNRGAESGGSLCGHLIPNQLQSSPEILVNPTVMTDMEYFENDVVLCYHGPLLYEAKVRLKCGDFRRGLR